MEKSAISDPAFSKFLEDLKKQNNQSFTTQLVQLKYEREIATDDNDKREEQLDDVIKGLQGVKDAVTGGKVTLDGTSLEADLSNQAKIFEKQLEELALIRKISEGSLEYDKESAQYRNKSGKELTSDVSGKTVKKGGYVDFETAANRLQGQGKRATEANRLELTPPGATSIGASTSQAIGATQKSNQFDPLAKKLSSVEVKPDDRTWLEAFKEIKSALTGGTFTAAKGRYSEEFVKAGKGTEEEGMKVYDRIVELEKKLEKSKEYGFEGSKEDQEELTKLKGGSLSVDNPKVQKRPEEELTATVSTPNAEADNIQTPLETISDNSKTDIELTKDIKTISEKQLEELKIISAALAPKTPSDLPEGRLKPSPASAEAAESGGGSGGGLGDMLPDIGKGLGKKLKAAGKGALSLGSKALKFMGGKGGAIAGSALAVGAGAYTAYKGYNAAEDSKNAKLEEVQAKVDSGEISTQDAAAARKEIGNTATVEKSGAVGEGTGMAAGGIIGMKAGAALGATIGSAVPILGTAVGAGVGALAGGAIGAFAGSKAGKYVGEKVGSGINAVKSFFGGDKKPEITTDGQAPDAKTVQQNFIADEPVVPGQPLSDKQMAVIGMSKSSGNSYSPEIEVQYAKQKKEVPGRAKGGPVEDGADYIVGEKGPELFMPFKDGVVIPNDTSKKIVNGKIGLAEGGMAYAKYADARAKGDLLNEENSGDTTFTSPEASSIIADLTTGLAKKYPELEKQYQASKLEAPSNESRAQMVAELQGMSTENRDLERESMQSKSSPTPIVMNNSSSNNSTSYVPIKASPRPDGASSLNRYQDRITHF
jgi:hypothetical protein